MPRYRNITTQAVITTTCVVTGGDWEEVDEPAKETKISVEEDDLEDAEEIEPEETEEPEGTVIATPAKPTSKNAGKAASRKGAGKVVLKSGGK